MPRIETWACKTCGKMKASTNNWWLVARTSETFHVRPMHSSANPLGNEDAVCGRECAQRELEFFLSGGGVMS